MRSAHAQTQLQYCGAALDLFCKLTVGSKEKCPLFKEHGDRSYSPGHKADISDTLYSTLMNTWVFPLLVYSMSFHKE